MRKTPLAFQHDPLARAFPPLDDGPSVEAHVSMLNYATGSLQVCAERSLLRLQQRLGNRYVQRVLGLGRALDAEAEVSLDGEQPVQRSRSGQAHDGGMLGQRNPAIHPSLRIGGGERLFRSPDMAQTLNLRRRYRYIGRGGAFADYDFEPDMSTDIRDWLTQNMSVFALERPFDSVAARLLAAFRQAHEDLGTQVALRRNEVYTYAARIDISGASVAISAVRINGHAWSPRPSPPTAARPVPLSPEVEGWWSALMTSFYTFYSDGSEEFHITFSRSPVQPLSLVSWRRHELTPGRQRQSTALRPLADFAREFRVNLSMAFESQPREHEIRHIVVRREGTGWSVSLNRIVPNPPPSQPGDEVILDRQRLYAQIFSQWRREVQAAGIMVAGIVAEELIWWIVGGAIIRGLGAVAMRGLPILRRLLEGRRVQQLARGLNRLSRAEAEEFVQISRRLQAGESVGASQLSRYREIAGRLEAELARLAPATVTRQEMTAFLRETWRQNPILQRVANAQRMSGPAQQRELVSILEQFERETGIGVQFVPAGTVQRAVGSGNLASLRSSPGVLQIERQVLQNTETLMREIRHELAFHYAGRLGRTPSIESFNALDLLEMMIQGMGNLPPPLMP